MLESIREGSQGLTAKIILGLVILTFALAGVGSYTNSVDTSLAEVNGEKISQQDFEQAFNAQRNRMQQQFGEMFDTLASDASYMANLRNSVLDQLINDVLISQQANDMALRISDEQLKSSIRSMPEFQVAGQFDNNRYLAIINQAGFYQSSDFRDYLRNEMVKRQLSQGIVFSEIALPYQRELAEKLNNQTRDIKHATISAEHFKGKVTVSDEEVDTYYKENSARFSTAEKVKVNYLVLDMNDVTATIETTDEELNTYYNDSLDSYRTEEQRRASHILIEFGDDEAAAEAKINELLAELNSGKDFAELAKAESQDTFSGENGGDLDWFGKGVMDEAFDNVVFAMEVGNVSNVVKSEFGFHIIKLTDVKAESVKPFDEVKDELLARLKSDKAQDVFYEKQQALAEMSFESPDSLDDAAEASGLTIKESAWLTRMGNPAPFNSPKMVNALFSDTVLTENVNSDVIEVTPELAVVVHLKEHEESKIKPLDEVSASIRVTLVAEKAQEAANAEAARLLAEVNQGNDITSALTEVSSSMEESLAVTRRGSVVDSAIVNKAFTLPHPNGSVSADIVKTNNGDSAIVVVDKVNVGEVKQDEIANNQQQTSAIAQTTYRNYIEAVKSTAEISKRTIAQDPNAIQ